MIRWLVVCIVVCMSHRQGHAVVNDGDDAPSDWEIDNPPPSDNYVDTPNPNDSDGNHVETPPTTQTTQIHSETLPASDYNEEQEDIPITTESYNNEEHEDRITHDQYNVVIKNYLETVDTTLIPSDNLAKALNMSMMFNILSLTNFDEIVGEIRVVSELDLSWVGNNLPRWTPNTTFAGKDSVAIKAEKVWTPQLILLNPSQSVKDLTELSGRLRLHHDGSVHWKVITGLQASCSIDVTNFPFDIQICNLMIAPWGYDSSEINIVGHTADGSIETVGSTGWELLDIQSSGVNDVTTPHLLVSLYFKRYYEYFLINILMPPVLLSILSPCAFLLPASSGERMSFSVTCFLSFSVFISLLGDNMPKSSVPIAHISYFMMYMLIHSCSVTVCTIISLRVYNKTSTENVPMWIQVLTKIVRFQCCNIRNRDVSDSSTIDHLGIATMNEAKINLSKQRTDSIISEISAQTMPMKGRKYGREGVEMCQHEVTWLCVARTLDYVFFSVFLGWMLFTIITFFMALNII